MTFYCYYYFSIGKQFLYGLHVNYVTFHDNTFCILRYNHIISDYGKVQQKNSGGSKYNVEVNQVTCTNRSTSVEQINDENSIGNVQINFGVIGMQTNLSDKNINIQINYVDCENSNSISEISFGNKSNRYLICKKSGMKKIFSQETPFFAYEISIIPCSQLSDSTKKVTGLKVLYKICVENHLID